MQRLIRSSCSSSVALVLDQDTDEVLFSKNPQAVLPIASLTKLMTALVVTEAGLPLDETLTDQRRGHRHREGQPFAARHRHAAVARRDAAPGADGVGEPRRQRARPALPRRHRRFRRCDEPQGAPNSACATRTTSSRPACRAETSRVHATSRLLVKAASRRTADPRAVDVAGVPGRRRPAPDPVPQHQRPRQQPAVGDRPAEDRLHLRGGALPGDAGQGSPAATDHGVPRLGRSQSRASAMPSAFAAGSPNYRH